MTHENFQLTTILLNCYLIGGNKLKMIPSHRTFLTRRRHCCVHELQMNAIQRRNGSGNECWFHPPFKWANAPNCFKLFSDVRTFQ